MKNIFLLFTIITLIASCTKETSKIPISSGGSEPIDSGTSARMTYINLNDKIVGQAGNFSLDINGDNTTDFIFRGVYTAGNLLNPGRHKYTVSSMTNSKLLLDSRDSTMVLHKHEWIMTFPLGYNWRNSSSLVMAQQVVPDSTDSYWEGAWQHVAHKYLPVQVIKFNQVYNGWVELSMDINTSRIILHRAAICKDPEEDIKAGQ